MLSKKEGVEFRATREGFSEGLIEAALHNEKIYAVCADLASSVGMKEFSEKFPHRFVEVGVAEQNLVTVASGLALAGKIPFASSFAMFSPGRNWEQIRTTICYNNQPVKIIGSHAGLGVGEDGATHQALEDVALMRVLPNMQVIVPCDAMQAKKAAIAISKTNSPVYMRIFRQKTQIITSEEDEFIIGKIQPIISVKGKNDVCIISAGPILCNALEAAQKLNSAGITCSVLNCHTIKPLDEKTLLEYAGNSKMIAVVEDHQIAGGLGGAVAELLSAINPKKILFMGMKDAFGESGPENELYVKYGLDAGGIAGAIKSEFGNKNKIKNNVNKVSDKKATILNIKPVKNKLLKKIKNKSKNKLKIFINRKVDTNVNKQKKQKKDNNYKIKKLNNANSTNRSKRMGR